MGEQIFVAVLLGLILSFILLGYGVWKELNWAKFFRENYLLPLFFFVCGTFGGYASGASLEPSLLFGLTAALLTSVMFALRSHSEFSLYKIKFPLSLQGLFGTPSKS